MATAGRFAVQSRWDDFLGVEVYELADAGTGSRARIVPAFGANLYSFAVPFGGMMLEVLDGPQPATLATLGYGTPILFPWPNRVRDGRFTFAGESYQLELDERGKAAHGLVRTLPWQVEEGGATALGARLRVSIDSTQFPALARQFPFPFLLSLTFILNGASICLEAEALNTGRSLMPLGFGIHPWFRLPLFLGGRRDDCLVQIPAARQWLLDRLVIPTGEVVAVPADKDYRIARPLGGHALDDLYTDLARSGATSECRLVDTRLGAALSVRADEAFREVVVYAPTHRPSICFEPYTCATDAFNLQSRGLNAGLVALPPGERWRGRIWFSVASSDALGPSAVEEA